MGENKDLDNAFLSACMRSEFDLAAELARNGADVRAVDSTGKTGLHHLLTENARRWPAHKEAFEEILQAGADLNQPSPAGTPMHIMAGFSATHGTPDRWSSYQAFLREAVEVYDADLSAIRQNQNGKQAVYIDFIRANKGFSPVVRTALSLLHEQDAPDPELNAAIGARWLQEMPSNSGMAVFAPWWAAGVDVRDVQGRFSHLSLKAVKQQFDDWQAQNPKLDPQEVSSLDELLTAHEVDADAKTLQGRCASPLFNPENWQQLDALIEACEKKDSLFTKNQVLEPVVGNKNFLQVAADIACRPRQAIELCNRMGIQLGAEDLLQQDGTPNDTLQSLIDAKSAHMLFSLSNWEGKRSSEMMQVYKALPPLDQSMVGNLHQLRAGLHAGVSAIGR